MVQFLGHSVFEFVVLISFWDQTSKVKVTVSNDSENTVNIISS